MLATLIGPAAATPAYAVGERDAVAEPQAPTAISGVVFRDFNANGTQDTYEPGVAGVTVTAYPASDTGNTGGISATTSSTGAFSLSTGAGQWRIEVTGYPDYLFPGAAGNTTVVFASDGASGVQIGLNNPGQYAPSSSAQTIVYVEHSSGIRYYGIGMSPVDDPVILKIPEDAGASSTNPDDYDNPAKLRAAKHSHVGAVWGLAHDRQRNVLYAASFIRRFVPLKGNPTTIYKIDLSTIDSASAWFTVDPARSDPHGSSPNWTQDFNVIPWVLKEGLGDLTISDDGKTLYAVDLGIRRLLQIPILPNGNPGTMVAVSLVQGTGNPYSLIQSTCPEMGDFRAFGLGYRDGRVYLGAVCTGESTVPSTSLPFDIDQKGPRPGDHSRLRGYVFEFDPSTSTWTVKLNFPLTYERGWVNWGRSGWYSDTTYARGSAKWSPWAPKYPCTGNNDYCWYPQPVISEIDFDNNGAIIIGMMDRFSLMDAYNAARPSGGVTLTPTAVGDILRACRTGERTWVMESLVVSGSGCNPPATRTRNHKIYHPTNTNYQAPIQEYYYQDDVKSDQADDGSVNNSPPGHSEIASGALVQIPGRSFVVSTSVDPGYHLDDPWEQSGFHWITNSTGAFLRGYVARDEQADGKWSKAGGLGDAEPVLPAAPLELGNRLWCDTGAGSNQVGAGNGVQDPGEPIISGATVQLQCDTDSNPGNGYEASATATTDSQGRYLFRDNTGGITAANGWPAAPWNSSLRIIPREAQCRLLINPNQSAIQQACGSGALPTIPDNGGSDSGANLRDSDGIPNVDGSGNTGVVFTTGGHGHNDHSWDFGFRPLDFGDAPDPGPGTGVGNYNTTAADNGPSHVILPNLRLGQTAPDADPGTLQNTAADADDTTNADDEDGVPTLPTVTTASTSVPLTVQVFNNRASDATVACWIDFNRDGDFLDAGEGASATVSSSSSLQTLNLTFSGFAPPTAGTSYLRCRVATVASEVANPTGPARSGEVEDYLLNITTATDFGDAPDTGPGTGVGNYETTAADNGPSHVIVPNLQLGSVPPDADPGTLQNTAADADDTTGVDDEDGVPTLPTVTTASTSVPLTVNVLNNTGLNATVACWMDFNRDGDFLDVGEGASATVASSPTLQAINLTFSGFAPPTAGVSYLRCRVANAASEVANPTGAANTGEVEDYQLTISTAALDFGDLPDTTAGTGPADYQTLLANNGPRHGIVSGVYLGATVDAETDGQPNVSATGDDVNGTPDDEDGVVFLHPLVPGFSADIQVTASVAGCLNAWVDWNGNGQLGDVSNEVIASNLAVSAGANIITVSPVPATSGVVYSRFRFTQACGQGGDSPTGLASSGEVEDYALAALGDYVWNDTNGNGQQDAGEPPVTGVTVNLLDSGGTQVLDANSTPITTVTDAGGNYSFPGLPPGSYIVEFVPPTGYTFTTPDVGPDTTDSDANPTTGRTAAIPLNPGDNNTTVDAGLVTLDYGDLPDGPYPTLLANNGARHVIVSGAAYLGTVPPDAEADGQPSAAATGDDVGGVDDEDGVTFLTPLMPGTTANIQVVITDSDGNACLSAFIDFNGDGVLDSVTYTAIDSVPGSGTVGDLALSSGTHLITISVPASTVGTTPARFRVTDECGQGGNSPTGLAPNGEVEDYVLARLGDYVWHDQNGNRQQDAGEPGVPGTTAKLLDGSENPVLDAAGNPITTVTDANGIYSFPGLPPGTYVVEFAPPPGYAFTAPNIGPDVTDSDVHQVTGRTTPPVTLGIGQVDLTVDAGLVQATGVTIGNLVFCDVNSNSKFDTGDVGQPGVTVRLYSLGTDGLPYTGDDVLEQSTTTDANGNYLFLPVNPGQYYVAVDPATVPASCGTQSSLGGGGNPDVGDHDVPNGDDGVPGYKAGEVVTGVLNAQINAQTTPDTGDPIGYTDPSAYMTVDFGFTDAPNAVGLNHLQARPVTLVEQLMSWLRRVLGR